MGKYLGCPNVANLACKFEKSRLFLMSTSVEVLEEIKYNIDIISVTRLVNLLDFG